MQVNLLERIYNGGKRLLSESKSLVTKPKQLNAVATKTLSSAVDEVVIGENAVSLVQEIPKSELERQALLSFFGKSKKYADLESKLTPEVVEVLGINAEKLSKLKFNPIYWLYRGKIKKHFLAGINKVYSDLVIVNSAEILRYHPPKMKYNFMEIGQVQTLLPFANGNKPAATLELIGMKSLNISHPNVDLIAHGEECTTLLNIKQVKALIEKNRAIYCNRLKCSQNASVDEIYARLESAIGSTEPGAIDDIYGITLGFPRKNSIIHQLVGFANKKYGTDYCWGNLRNATPETIEEFKLGLRKALKEQDSPYANADKTLVKEIEEAINKITKIDSSEEQLNPSRFNPDFVMYTPEPDEIAKINANIAKLEETITAGRTLKL